MAAPQGEESPDTKWREVQLKSWMLQGKPVARKVSQKTYSPFRGDGEKAVQETTVRTRNGVLQDKPLPVQGQIGNETRPVSCVGSNSALKFRVSAA